MFRINYIKDSKGYRALESVVLENEIGLAEFMDEEGSRFLELPKYYFYPVADGSVNKTSKGRLLMGLHGENFCFDVIDCYTGSVPIDLLGEPSSVVLSVSTSDLKRLVNFINGGNPKSENLELSYPFVYDTYLNGTIIEPPKTTALGLDSEEIGFSDADSKVDFITTLTLDEFMYQMNWLEYRGEPYESTGWGISYATRDYSLSLTGLEYQILDRYLDSYKTIHVTFYKVLDGYGVLLIDDNAVMNEIKEWLSSLTVESYVYNF